MSTPAALTDYEYVLRVVDIETTGMEPPEAEVIEIGWQDVCRTSHESWVFAEDEHGSMLFGCEKPCPPEVIVSGIPSGGFGARPVAFDDRGGVYIAIGGGGNSCTDKPGPAGKPVEATSTQSEIWVRAGDGWYFLPK